MKSGFIGIIGRPNTGNLHFLIFLGEKVYTSDKPRTTKKQNYGYLRISKYVRKWYTDDFLDAPGIHKPKKMTGAAINRTAINTMGAGVDVVLLQMGQRSSEGRQYILDMLAQSDSRKCLQSTRLVSGPIILNLYGHDESGLFDEIFGISALQDTNVNKLMKC